MCNNYEAQLQTVQDEYREEQARNRSLDRELKAEKQTIESRKSYITELEESLKDAANNANDEVGTCLNMILSSSSSFLFYWWDICSNMLTQPLTVRTIWSYLILNKYIYAQVLLVIQLCGIVLYRHC